MNEVVTTNPFAANVPAQSRQGGNAVAQTDQQRAVAEVQAAMMIARMNPRDQIAAMDRILNSCARPTLADAAVYTYSKGGSDVSGPSIRLAEAMAQAWGNMQFGIRELDQANGESTVQAYAWDVETNTRREITFQVPHIRHTRKGAYKLEDPREIYELVANQGARRLRACILAVIPGDVTEAAVTQCETTMRTKADTSPEAMQKMVAAFEPFGVTKEQIEKRIQRRLDAIQPAQVVSLKKIYASLRDGMSTPADWFEAAEGEAPTTAHATASRTDSVKAKARAQRESSAQQKPPASDLQDDALRDLEQGQQQSTSVSFAQVSDQLHKAKDLDLLDAAADLIGEVADPTHREELGGIYRQRRAELEQA
ncbi:hypothetical protein [Ralstonia syzygii]|uniref:hypothetical protein n=1 Tax=Ralstonia syzygii TaxID=28097 RepID=UPI0035176B0B